MKQTKPGPRPKPIPQRTCIACRQVAGKRALLRIVRTVDGVEVDPTGKRAGRGAYLHPDPACWQAALQGNRLAQALRTTIAPENKRQLLAQLARLAGEDAKTLAPEQQTDATA